MAMKDQQELISFLNSPKSYPHRPTTVQFIQTHISYVTIASPYVYKVKKPVELGFLDFSTLEKRRKVCEQEIALNRRLCLDTYEEVIPISRVDGALKMNDDRNIVEYAVKMKELSTQGFLNKRLEKGRLKPQDLNCVVDRLLQFYQKQTPLAEVAEWGRTEKLKRNIQENFDQTERFIDDLIALHSYQAIKLFNDQFFLCFTPLLNRRRVNGRILDCHGDLRLEHIHLSQNEVRIFDCIEFNDRFRYIDVANETAFLAKDLDFYGRSDLAKHFVERMAERLDDPDLIRLANFYKCYRAYVRAKVHSLKSIDLEISNEDQQKSREKAVRLYQLSLEYAVRDTLPMVIVIMGRIGTGKSTVAKGLSVALGWEIVSSDEERKKIAGLPLTVRPNTGDRERLYSAEMTNKTYETMIEKALKLSHNQKCCLLDATFGNPRHRRELRNALALKNIPYRLVELKASDDPIKERLQNREFTNNYISDARLEDFSKLTRRYHPVDALEDAWHVIVNSEQLLEKTLCEVLEGVMLLKELKGPYPLSRINPI